MSKKKPPDVKPHLLHLHLAETAGRAVRRKIDLGDAMSHAIDETVIESFRSGIPQLGYVPGYGKHDISVDRITRVGFGWLSCGFPVIEVATSLAASLMCTEIPRDVISAVRFPWPCFAVRCPAGLIGQREDVFMVNIEQDEGAQLEFVVHRGDSYGFTGVPLCLAHGASKNRKDYLDRLCDDPLYNRLMRLRLRLFLGVCLEMSTPERVQEMTRGASGRSHRRGLNTEPTRWRFRLGRPVKADMREAVAAYVSGERKRLLSVQHMVRGHFKNQPYGKNRDKRKLIHVEPYWRGPDDAPIAVRTHFVERRK